MINSTDISTFKVPEKNPERLRLALSHEFVELYRGDKDLRVGKLFCRKYDAEIVHFGTDIASPADSRVFNDVSFSSAHVGQLPDSYYLLLMKSKLIYHRRGNISLGGFFRYTPGLAREIIRWKPDLILENPYLTLTPRSYMSALAAYRLSIPLVYLDCGDIMPALTLKHKLVMPIEKTVARRAAAVITYNEAGKNRFIQKYGMPPESIHVIPKPVDIDRFKSNIDGRRIRDRYRLQDKLVVSYFGRLETNKGARYLLDAAAILRSDPSVRNLSFMFVGGNLESDQALAFSNHLRELNLDNVIVTGMIPNQDMPEYYAASDIAVYPDVTNLPGFSTVLAESMACGLPIIIGIAGWESAVPLKDIETALIIPPRRPDLIADKLRLLVHRPELRRSLSQNVSAYAQNNMSYDRVVDKYYELFCRLLKRPIGKGTKLNEYDKHPGHEIPICR